jgi:hypothetical protein
VAWVTSVRIDRFASLLAFRISPRTAAAAGYTEVSADANDARSSAPGHDARWIDPSRHHDHTSSVTKGMCGANSRKSVSSATASAARAESEPE